LNRIGNNLTLFLSGRPENVGAFYIYPDKEMQKSHISPSLRLIWRPNATRPRISRKHPQNSTGIACETYTDQNNV